ncbi:unnamed protein product, partial [marine sediment metagenome]
APEGIFIEIGVFKGKSAAILAEAQPLTLILIDDLSLDGADMDSWPQGRNIWSFCGRPLKWITEGISLLHHDASHEYDVVFADLERYLPQMVNNGLVVLHDFHGNSYPDVRRAWEAASEPYHWRHGGSADSVQVFQVYE